MTCYEYLASKGVEMIPTVKGWKCLCPIPTHDDHEPSCHIYQDGEQGNWWCFSCRKGSDLYALVMAVEQCGFTQAVEIVGEPPAVRAYNMGLVRGQLMSGQIGFDVADHLYRRFWYGEGL